MSKLYNRRLPDIEWNALPAATVSRYFAVVPERGLLETEVDKRRAWFGGNKAHGMHAAVAEVYTVKLRRNGQITMVSLPEIVLGDVVILEPGRRVPARLRLVQSNALQLHEAATPGALVVAHKRIHVGSHMANSAVTGAVVLGGYGEGIVVGFDRFDSPRSKLRLRLKRLRKHGFIVQNTHALQRLRSIKSIVVVADTDVTSIKELAMLAAQRGVALHWVVPTDTTVPDDTAHFVSRFTDVPSVLKRMRRLQLQHGTVAWIHDGTSMRMYRGVADITVALTSAPDADKLHADLLATGSASEAVERYLYNVL